MAGFLAAFVALAPAALRRRPQGRRVAVLRRSRPEADVSPAGEAAPAEQALQR
jgi:hypothetical protein